MLSEGGATRTNECLITNPRRALSRARKSAARDEGRDRSASSRTTGELIEDRLQLVDVVFQSSLARLAQAGGKLG